MNTKEKIIRAGLKIFSEKGYERATTRAIAAEAGVNEVTLFRIFQNKKNILRAVISANRPISISQSDFQKKLTGNLETDLFQICLGFYHGLKRNRRAILMSLCAAEQHPEIREIVASGPEMQQEMLNGYFIRLKSQRQIGDIDTAALTRQIIEMIFGLCISSGLTDNWNDKKISHTIKHFTGHLVHGIRERNK